MEIHVQKEPSDTIHFYLFVLTQSSKTMHMCLNYWWLRKNTNVQIEPWKLSCRVCFVVFN